MDDITIGVDDKKEAISIISDISDMLKSRGLALNISKTAIFNNSDAEYHFQIGINQFLDGLALVKPNTKLAKKQEKELVRLFKMHLKDRVPKYWEKVAKRFVTAFGRLQSKSILKILPSLYLEHAGLRPNLLFYLGNIGYSKECAASLVKVLEDLSVFDDISVFQISNLLTQWDISIDEQGLQYVSRFDALITEHWKNQKEPSGFYSLLWFKAKYSNSNALRRFIKDNQSVWQSDSFLRRQATACLSRLMIQENAWLDKLLTQQVASGVDGTVSVANQINSFMKLEGLDQRISSYLFPTTMQTVYPLAKFLVLCSALNSEKIRNDPSVKKRIKIYIKDKTYRTWLERDYEIAFN